MCLGVSEDSLFEWQCSQVKKLAPAASSREHWACNVGHKKFDSTEHSNKLEPFKKVGDSVLMEKLG